jgi:hypothetical protein
VGEWRKRSTVTPADLWLVLLAAGICVLTAVLILADLGVL